MKYGLPVFLLCILPLSLFAQWEDTDRLSPSFHRERREALRKLLPEKSVAVFFANPIRNRSNDVDFQYSQDPNFYYLTGCIEPNALLLIFKEPRTFDGINTDEVLFVEERNAKDELWTGRRLGAEGARARLGFKSAYTGKEWQDFGVNFATLKEVLTILPESPNSSKFEEADLFDLVSALQKKLKAAEGVNVDISSLYRLMSQLREVKLPEEQVLLQKAMDVTIDGFKEMLRKIKPGWTEYQAQAEVEYHARFQGAEYMGYPSICGAGNNACVLHYTSNRKISDSTELILVDMGAEYHGYTADITRTIPVNGRFSPEQAVLYNIVLEAQNAGIAACTPGADFRASHRAAEKVIARKLKELGIIQQEKDVDTYFMHGTSHYLGLDVHDAGTYGALKEGVVLTVEPGIYIPEGAACDKKWWGIGIRIEDDILVTSSRPMVMTRALPRTIAELESLMQQD